MRSIPNRRVDAARCSSSAVAEMNAEQRAGSIVPLIPAHYPGLQVDSTPIQLSVARRVGAQIAMFR